MPLPDRDRSGVWAAEVGVVAVTPDTPGRYKARLDEVHGLAHATVEVHARPAGPGATVTE